MIYSNVTGSSTLSLWLWHSTCARLIRIRASAVKPANAITTWLSSRQIFRTVRSSCSLATDFFSTPKTTTFAPRTPTFSAEEMQIKMPEIYEQIGFGIILIRIWYPLICDSNRWFGRNAHISWFSALQISSMTCNFQCLADS